MFPNNELADEVVKTLRKRGFEETKMRPVGSYFDMTPEAKDVILRLVCELEYVSFLDTHKHTHFFFFGCFSFLTQAGQHLHCKIPSAHTSGGSSGHPDAALECCKGAEG